MLVGQLVRALGALLDRLQDPVPVALGKRPELAYPWLDLARRVNPADALSVCVLDVIAQPRVDPHYDTICVDHRRGCSDRRIRPTVHRSAGRGCASPCGQNHPGAVPIRPATPGRPAGAAAPDRPHPRQPGCPRTTCQPAERTRSGANAGVVLGRLGRRKLHPPLTLRYPPPRGDARRLLTAPPPQQSREHQEHHHQTRMNKKTPAPPPTGMKMKCPRPPSPPPPRPEPPNPELPPPARATAGATATSAPSTAAISTLNALLMARPSPAQDNPRPKGFSTRLPAEHTTPRLASRTARNRRIAPTAEHAPAMKVSQSTVCGGARSL